MVDYGFNPSLVELVNKILDELRDEAKQSINATGISMSKYLGIAEGILENRGSRISDEEFQRRAGR